MSATGWLRALDEFAAEVARRREAASALGDDFLARGLEPLRFAFPTDLGPLPPDLATYARAVLADALLLEDELDVIGAGMRAELRAMHERGRSRFAATATTGRTLDRTA